MVAELHVRGYQRLRVVPHIYGLGTWRCGITAAANVRPDHGAIAVNWDWNMLPQYTSAGENKVLDWEDSLNATPSGLARRFIERFPRVAEAGYGPDWLYSGWLTNLLHLTFGTGLPYAFAEYETPTSYLYCTGSDLQIPLPPPGFASPAEARANQFHTFDLPPL